MNLLITIALRLLLMKAYICTRLQQYNILEEKPMYYQKDNYLQIKYETKKGLFLSWNFKDLNNIHNYYHHLFIVFETSVSFNKNMVQLYYKKMKFGDLIGFIYYHPLHGPKMLNWIEKSQLSNFQSQKIRSRLDQEELNQQKLYKLLEYAAKYTIQNNTSNLICNFVLSKQLSKDSDDFIKKIGIFRQESGFFYHCTIFNPICTNRICFSSGIHFLNSDYKELSSVLSFYHSIINNAAVQFAKVTIECLNGQMMSYDTKIWSNLDFNKIQRKFYGPSINYEEDFIQFHVLDAFDQDAFFEMAITLQLVLFSSQKIVSNKRMRISFADERHYDKSVNLSVSQTVLMIQGVQLKTNPYSTYTFVRLMKSFCRDIGEIKSKIEQASRTRRQRDRTRALKSRQQQEKQLQQLKKCQTNVHQKPLQYFVPHNRYNEEEI